jgi:DNA-directed RNA polymerase alpha subunit
MISIKKQSKTVPAKFSDEARLAIARGVQRDDPVANLEYLGLTLRTINILENSDFQITKLSELVLRKRDELLSIPNVTPSVMREILNSLSRYHLLEEAQRHAPPLVAPAGRDD